MELSTINWLAVLVAALSTFILGGLWYGPLFGRSWMRASGMTEERANAGNKGRIFGLSLVLQFIAALVLDMFIGAEGNLAFGTAAGAAVGIFWVATAFAVVYLFEQRPVGHWAVNAFYHIVSYTVMGAILGGWN
ncbi:MAG TPA: DUF1761 domain-containing protein [Longimicrobiales bacterium]